MCSELLCSSTVVWFCVRTPKKDQQFRTTKLQKKCINKNKYIKKNEIYIKKNEATPRALTCCHHNHIYGVKPNYKCSLVLTCMSPMTKMFVHCGSGFVYIINYRANSICSTC